MLLWDEQYDPDDERDDDDSPSERVSWYPGEECYKKVVDRLIYDGRER